jgi:GNAT superfamily N-acetyltransferase
MTKLPPEIQVSINIVDNPEPAEIAAIQQGLADYNNQFSENDNHQLLTILLRDANNQLAGGLLGGTYWRWLHIDILWLRQDLRQQGYGSRLLQTAEQEAIQRDCRHAHLETHEFQALPFYQKHGYVVFGELADLPPGHVKYFLKKDFPNANQSQTT